MDSMFLLISLLLLSTSPTLSPASRVCDEAKSLMKITGSVARDANGSLSHAWQLAKQAEANAIRVREAAGNKVRCNRDAIRAAEETMHTAYRAAFHANCPAVNARSAANEALRMVEDACRKDYNCILLLGLENEQWLVELYNPTGNCSLDRSQLATEWMQLTVKTSGCYLKYSNKIVIRGAKHKPPVVYSLEDGSYKNLSFPYKASNGTTESTAASTNGGWGCLSCGGKDLGSFRDSALCFEYDESADRWSPIASLPEPLYYPASVSLAEDTYVVGGVVRDEQSNQTYRYNSVDREWHTETPMPKSRHGHAAAALSDTEFIVCGGYMFDRKCSIYDVVTKRWRAGGELNLGRQGFAMVVFAGEVYALGGEGLGYHSMTSVESYTICLKKESVSTPKRRILYFL